jgi:hypothetical protein
MWYLETRCQIALREGSILSRGPQFRTKSTIFSCVGRFFHCSHYRNVLECSQIRYTIMLTLPEDWRSLTGGAVIAHLFGEVPEHSLHKEIAKHLIGACLDVAAAGISLRGQTNLVVKSLPNARWEIGEYTYVYFHDINNEALTRAIEMGSRRFWGSIVVRPRYEEVLWRACQSILGNRTPSILALDTLVNLRTLFTSGDCGWPYERVMLDILRRYNRRTLDRTYDDRILVDIPPDDSCPP